jgi:predicted DNA-binding protein (UPF0251 family)
MRMTRWVGYYTSDPLDIENRFSTDDAFIFPSATMSEENQQKLERIKGIIDSLPPREADFVELYYFNQLKQTDIAVIFGVSQPTVCYRLQRATARIQFQLSLPVVERDQLDKDIEGFLADPLDVNIMKMMYETTCQSEVASKLNVSQGLVRHRFIRSIKRMSENSRMAIYAEIFTLISKNLNILREVQRNKVSDEKIYRLA